MIEPLGRSRGFWGRRSAGTPIQRSEPGFQCRALISKTEVQAAETEALIGKLFDGSPDLLFASLLDSRKLSAEQLERLKKLVFAMEQEHRS